MKEGKEKENDRKTGEYWKDQGENYKEYIRQNPLKKRKERISQRSKKDPITVESFFTSFPRKQKGSFSFLHPELKGVKLKVTATPDAWKKVESFTLDNPDWFGLEFHSCFANPAVLEIREKNKPRGKQKRIYYFINDIKIRAGIVYAFFSYWCRKPLEEWLDYLKNLIKAAKKDGYIIYIFSQEGKRNPPIKKLMGKGTNPPYRMAKYSIEKVYREEIHGLKLKLFDDPFNFIKNYIHADGRAERLTKFFNSKSPQEVATFAHTYPALRYIFETLQVF